MSKTTRGGPTTVTTSTYLHTEFLAEDTMISIVPTFECPAMKLVRGDFGPFKPSIATEVPLWLALTLKKLHKCSIQAPDWLNVEYLEDRLMAERRTIMNDDDAFDSAAGDGDLQKLPRYLSQISALLLHHASDDLRDAHQLRRLLEDLQTVRAAKLRSRLRQDLRLPIDAYALGRLTALEVDTSRPIVTRIMTDLYRYGAAALNRSGVGTFSATGSGERETATVATPQSATAIRPRQLRRIQRNV